MRSPSQGPLDAVVLPDPPPKPPSTAWKGWVLATGAFVLFVACSGAGMWGIARVTRLGMSGTGPKGSLVYAWETPDQRNANVAAAMDAQSVGCTPAELRELTRFFTRLVETLAAEENSAFREHVDIGAFSRRASLHPAAKDFDRLELEEQLEYDLDGPLGWMDFSIVHVARGKVAGEALVYVVLSNDGSSPTPFRWWLSRSGRAWKICDWEMIELGYSESSRWVLTQELDDDPKNSDYWLVSSAIERSYDEVKGGNVVAAQAQLQNAEKKKLPGLVHDMTQIELARAWQNAGRPERALAACERVRKPAAESGIYYSRAMAYSDLQREAEMLDALEKYRDLAGCHPELLRLEAEALESQGKTSQSADCWRELLRLMPEDDDALSGFCRLADDSQRAQIKPTLDRLRKPVERAETAAISAAQDDDVRGLAVLLDYLRAKAPNSAAIEHVLAVQLDADEKYFEAAQHFAKARELEERADKKLEYFHEYLGSMALADRGVEAYLAADDRDEAFTYLTRGFEDEEAFVSDEALAALIALHRQRKPDDPQLDYFSGLLLLKQGQFAAAEDMLTKAEANAVDTELEDLARSSRLEAIYRQGEITEAYAAAGEDPADTFRELAWLCDRRRDWKGLGELIALHRKNQPRDPWLDYFTALREQGAGNRSAALAAVLRAEAAEDESLETLCTWLKTDLYVESDNVSQAYMKGGPPTEAFDRLVNRLTDDADWDRVLELAQLHAAVAPSEPASLYHTVKARWHKQQYQQLVQLLTPWPAEQLKTADQAWIEEIADLHVRSWLRQGNIDEARAAAERAKTDHGHELPLVAVELAAGNHGRVRELLGERRLGGEFFDLQLDRDRDLRAVLTDPQFAELRRKYGLESPDDYGLRKTQIVILLSQPADRGRIKQEFENAVGSEAAGKLRELSGVAGDSGRYSLVVELNDDTLAITCSDGAYCHCDSLHSEFGHVGPLLDAAERHAAWIAIDLLHPDQPGSTGPIEHSAQRLAAAFCDEQALAVYVTRPRADRQRFTLVDAAVREELAAGKLLASAARGSDEDGIYLYESAVENRHADPLPWPERRKQIRQLADQARVENTAGHAQVRIRLTRGHAEEDLWLNVIRFQRGLYGDEHFIAELTTESRLWPHLRPGERLRIGFYEAREVRAVAPSP